ncbi:MAG TPA: RdgB/HAM1 family non-canonical purine NTP pyrophosphatase [Chitinophagaceae bacterium]
MKRIIFATNNQHKVDEIRAVTGNRFAIVTMKEAGIDLDIPEPHETLQENAIEKALTINRLTGENVFSEDTGLEVTALNGEPGVHSARYAGDGRDFHANVVKLLKNLQGCKDRRARFRTVICLIWNGTQHLFEGICEGQITTEERGEGGFGYDPVFIPDGDSRSFAEMTTDEKNRYSHRAKATARLVHFLAAQPAG